MIDSHWYAVAIASIAACFVSVWAVRIAIYLIDAYLSHYILKFVYYKQVHHYVLGRLTWFHVFLVVAFLAGNAVYLYIQHDTLMKQVGTLSAINLIPLALGGHMNPIVDTLGIPLEGYNQMHRWIARVAVIEAVLHSILALAAGTSEVHGSAYYAAIVAVTAMVLLIITSFSGLRRRFYEVFQKIHLLLAVVVITAVWVHVPRRIVAVPTLYLLTAGTVWTALRLYRLGTVHLYRNRRLGHGRCQAVVWSVPDAYQVHVKVARPWDYSAGQYVYLCIRKELSRVQWHPYFLAWWYVDEKGSDTVVLIVSRQTGFSESLENYSSGVLVLGVSKNDGKPRMILATDSGIPVGNDISALVEGPYGQGVALGNYGTVLLIATGIGIASLLPFIREFLQGFHNWDVKARRIALYWEVESEQHLQWVGNWITELLSEDNKYILDIRIYVKGDYVTRGAEHGKQGEAGSHKRIQMAYRALDVADVTSTELRARRGRSVILLCVKRSVGYQARQAARSIMSRDKEPIRLVELPFTPT